MQVWINGNTLPSTQAVVPVSDRSFLYGDGLFESILFRHGRPFLWNEHWQRLQAGLEFLQIKTGFQSQFLRDAAIKLAAANSLAAGILRITVSRGSGTRGYSTRNGSSPTIVLSFHSAPDLHADHQWALITSQQPCFARNPLNRHKTANKLLHVLARRDADQAGANDAILLNESANLVETSSGNIFAIQDNRLLTPPLADGPLPGTTRSLVLQLARDHLRVPAEENPIPAALLPTLQTLFVTLSSLGVVPVFSLDGRRLHSHPLVATLKQAFLQRLEQETTE